MLGIWCREFPNPKFDSQSNERITNTIGEIKNFLHIDFAKLSKKIIANESIIMPAIDAIIRKKEAIEKRTATLALKKVQKQKIVNHIAATSNKIEEKQIFLTEGLSAAGTGVETRDPKIHGFYALRGKVLNTHNMKSVDILKNKELSELCAIIGLDLETNTCDLNYGKINLLSDQDNDGHAICCLLVMFFSRWQQLFDENRICRINTPLYIAEKKGRKTLYYYDQAEYENRKENLNGYEISYIKGLGSLSKQQYKDCIINNPRVTVLKLDDIDKLNMIFGDDADARKDWMLK